LNKLCFKEKLIKNFVSSNNYELINTLKISQISVMSEMLMRKPHFGSSKNSHKPHIKVCGTHKNFLINKIKCFNE